MNIKQIIAMIVTFKFNRANDSEIEMLREFIESQQKTIEDLRSDVIELTDTIECNELVNQKAIKDMKCCGNCKHFKENYNCNLYFKCNECNTVEYPSEDCFWELKK